MIMALSKVATAIIPISVVKKYICCVPPKFHSTFSGCQKNESDEKKRRSQQHPRPGPKTDAIFCQEQKRLCHPSVHASPNADGASHHVPVKTQTQCNEGYDQFLRDEGHSWRY